MSQQKAPNDAQTVTDPLLGRVIMFDVLKGGYGKSTLSVNVADRLAARGHDVLYVDLDPNGHITSALGYEHVYNDRDGDLGYEHNYGYVIADKGHYRHEDLDPRELIYETEWGWDFVPAYRELEDLDYLLREMSSSQALAQKFFYPLFDAEEYDFCIIDGGGERSRIADNGFAAGRRAMMPICPGEESKSAVHRTRDRVIEPIQKTNSQFELLAAIPNMLSKRIDQQTDDRVLLELLNGSAYLRDKLPEFARFTDEEFARIDNGTIDRLPGIRRHASIGAAISKGMPVAHYDPDCTQIKHFDELAHIIEEQEVLDDA